MCAKNPPAFMRLFFSLSVELALSIAKLLLLLSYFDSTITCFSFFKPVGIGQDSTRYVYSAVFLKSTVSRKRMVASLWQLAFLGLFAFGKFLQNFQTPPFFSWRNKI